MTKILLASLAAPRPTSPTRPREFDAFENTSKKGPALFSVESDITEFECIKGI